MNNSSIDTDVLLEKFNKEKAILMIPATLYLCILMITGLIGNSMACVYYGYRAKQTSNSIFIVVLAMFDLVICTLSIPIEIADLALFYMFTSGSACKLLRFINHFAAIGSAFTLIAISVDRFKRICRPFNKQLNNREAKIVCLLTAGLSVLCSWPALVFYDAVSVDIKNDIGIDIKGSDCTTIRDKSYTLYRSIFNGVHFLTFIICTAVLAVIYSMIGRVILRHKQTQKRFSAVPVSANSESSGNTSVQSCLTETSFSVTDVSTNKTIQKRENEKTGKGNEIGTKRIEFVQAAADSNGNNKQKNATLDLKTVKYTIIMFVVTVLFVLSFLPYLALVIWRVSIGGYEVGVLSDGELVGFQIGLRSYMLNSAINPIAYGFFNSKFRRFFYMTLCPCFSRKSINVSVSTSSGNN